MKDITKPERPVKELLIYCLDPREARAVSDCFCFSYNIYAYHTPLTFFSLDKKYNKDKYNNDSI